MTRMEAMVMYCALNSKASSSVIKLMRWDETKTVLENAKILRISPQNAVCLSKRYSLDYKRSRKPSRQFSMPRTHTQAVCV